LRAEGQRETVTVGRTRLRVPRVSWALLTTVTTLGTLNGLYLLLVPVGDQTELAGRTWERFAAQDPEVASIYAMDLAVLGIIWAAFGLLGSIVSVVPYRRGDRWAWYALWLVPITYGAAATRFLIDRYDAGFWIAGLTAAAVVGLLIPIRRVLGGRASMTSEARGPSSAAG
jgi:hypothetical protein